MLLGVLDTYARLRLYPMNLICIITAQGNGMVFIVHRLGLGRVLCVVQKHFNNENHPFQHRTFGGARCREV